MKELLIITLLTICSTYGISQTFSSQDPAYIDNVTAGEAKLNAMDYDSCVSYYQMAFEIKQTSYLSLLRGAACASSSDQPELWTSMDRGVISQTCG